MTTVRLPLDALTAGRRTLPEDASRYVCRVHRLTAGASLVVFDPGAALEADAVLVVADGKRAVVEVTAPRPAWRLPSRSVVLLQGVGKGDRFDTVVREATALGVTRLVAVETERTVVKVATDRAAKKRDRWAAIAVAAARQSERGDLPEVVGPEPLPAALARADGAAFVLDPAASARFGAALAAVPPGSAITLLIGPEGGLTDDEVAMATEAGFRSVCFGRFVLRTETAATAVLGAIVAAERE